MWQRPLDVTCACFCYVFSPVLQNISFYCLCIENYSEKKAKQYSKDGKQGYCKLEMYKHTQSITLQRSLIENHEKLIILPL